jgi:hypothetical protein
MIGSPLAPIVTAIASVIALAVWLAMMFYADAHPPQADSHAVAGRDRGREITGQDGRQQNDRPGTTPAHAPEAEGGVTA